MLDRDESGTVQGNRMDTGWSNVRIWALVGTIRIMTWTGSRRQKPADNYGGLFFLKQSQVAFLNFPQHGIRSWDRVNGGTTQDGCLLASHRHPSSLSFLSLPPQTHTVHLTPPRQAVSSDLVSDTYPSPSCSLRAMASFFLPAKMKAKCSR